MITESKEYSKRSHITVSIPRDLINEIKSLINDKEIKGYRNHSEFIIEAIRLRLEEVEKKEIKQLLEEFKKFRSKFK